MTPSNPAEDDLLLVVDAGGTKTAAWLVDPARPETDRILGRGRATAGNPLSVGLAQSSRVIEEAVAGAISDARRPAVSVARAILSIAGAANRQLHEYFTDRVRETRLAERVAVVSDVLPVLAAGTANCVGVAVISGTGSVAFGRAADDRTTLCGGWGYLLGDEGSGYAIGRAALQFALQKLEADAQRQTFDDAVLRQIGARTVLETTRAVYRSADQRAAIAAVAPVVIRAADEDDPAAQAIIDAAAADLAKLVARCVRRLEPVDSPIGVAAAGGVIVSSRRLREQLRVQLRRLALNCEVTVVEEPLEGCVRLAEPRFSDALVTWH